ncbi:hypothetical protein Bca52824_072134 [Brassica carinata]|uniref:RNase H type-1 domain-containing protein n=1 Tax=Brassica carinata TaxID=52824 RepID=A0A8X7Q7L9_BRACI|nr:hypothetical protein Bca52824_072134 [Brassica carinata]
MFYLLRSIMGHSRRQKISVSDEISGDKALAIRGAPLNAASLDFHNICLRSDSRELIRAINRRKWTIELHGVLSDIDSLVFSASSTFTFCRFEFIPRSTNGPADRLAKAHLSLY